MIDSIEGRTMEALWIVLAVYLGIGVLVAYFTMYTGPHGLRIDRGPFVLWVVIWPLALVARSRAIAALEALSRTQEGQATQRHTDGP